MATLTEGSRPLPTFAAGLAVFAIALGSTAGEWAQWRGPNRDGVSADAGLLQAWPDGGPALLWELSGIGDGSSHSSVTIAGGKLFTTGLIGGKQQVKAFDAETRNEQWSTEISGNAGRSNSTPTVDDGLLYVVSGDGVLFCLDAKSGEQRWRKSFAEEYGVKGTPTWKFAESVLVDGDGVICTPGADTAVLAAFDKRTGDEVWRSALPDNLKGTQAQYSSIIVTEAEGVRQYITLVRSLGAIGVAAKDGEFLWNYRRVSNGTANIATPLVHDGHVFVSTAYGTGSALLKLTGRAVEEVYFLNSDTFQNHHGGYVRLGDYIYGGHGHNKGAPTCIELKTGKVVWQAEQPGKGSAGVTLADGRLYFQYQDGTVALVDATPAGYRLQGTFSLPGQQGPAWAHPVILDGKLYARWASKLFCYNVRK